MTSSSPRQTAPPLLLSRIMKETSNTVDLPNKIIVLVAKERILNAGSDTHRR
ncbi:hypothetical protein B0H14DRAFT_3464547 [Mycena olivaceomarginata]|nr:hypothetical protein B0H14DRAFT_3464547 [Mycena olivaceomarginata]